MENEAVKSLLRFYPITVVVALWIVFVGCGSTAPSRLYTLTALATSVDNTHVSRNESHLSVAVGPVQLPKYLERPQIVTRISPNKIESADFDRWAEPLEDNVSRVLVENLTHLLWNDGITVFPWIDSTAVNYRISVNITQFDGQKGGTVFLIAGWAIHDNKKKSMVSEKRSVIKVASEHENYEAMVSAKSRALADLSREMAERIRLLVKRETVVQKQ